MAYQIITSPVETAIKPLGISLSSLETNYLSKDQASENLKNLLLTTPGERYGTPQFGCPLLELLFQPSTVTEIQSTVIDVINTAVDAWLDYIDIEQIDVITAEDDPEQENFISIKVTYFIQPDIDPNSIEISIGNDGLIQVSETTG